MHENVGTLDRTARFVAGPLLMGLGATALGGLRGRPRGLVALVAGALVAESAVTRVCPVNRLLGIDTREKARAGLLAPRGLASWVVRVLGRWSRSRRR